MIYLDEDDSFSMSGYVESPGYVRFALQGYLVSRRSDGVYVAPLIPQLFYGWDGAQLQTWRQNITAAGEQTLLTRQAGGYPKVPMHELAWRKVSEPVTQVQVAPARVQEPSPVGGLILIGLILFLIFGK